MTALDHRLFLLWSTVAEERYIGSPAYAAKRRPNVYGRIKNGGSEKSIRSSKLLCIGHCRFEIEGAEREAIERVSQWEITKGLNRAFCRHDTHRLPTGGQKKIHEVDS